MTCETVIDLIDDFDAGRLPGTEREDVARHLADCAPCRDELESFRALRAQVAGLPRSIEPPRDLWPAIAAAIDARVATANRPPRRRRWPALIAAAAVLVAATAAVTTVLQRPDAPARRGVVLAPAVLPASYRTAESDALSAEQELLAIYNARRARLAPGTVAVIEKNLAIIDRAVGEARSALQRDPASYAVGQAYTELLRHKLDLLRTAADVTL